MTTGKWFAVTAGTWSAAAAALLCALALACAPAAHAASSNANTAALQVALKALHHYNGGIDGVAGPRTKRAVRRFQRARRLPADGVAGPRTRAALGKRGKPLLGKRILQRGDRGWDVAAVQFMLRRRGFSPGSVDGGFGAGTEAAVERLQAARGLPADGRVGSATLRALRRAGATTAPVSSTTPVGAVRFLRPLNAPMGDGFGWVSGRNHTGIDFPAASGTPVGAAGVGTVKFAGWNTGGYGNLIVVEHRLGYETWYAHLSAFSVGPGASVAGGTQIGLVGSTGRSTGPHLHWEVRKDGVPIDPAPYMLQGSSVKLVAGSRGHDLECTDDPAPPPLARRHAADPARAVLPHCGH